MREIRVDGKKGLTRKIKVKNFLDKYEIYSFEQAALSKSRSVVQLTYNDITYEYDVI